MLTASINFGESVQKVASTRLTAQRRVPDRQGRGRDDDPSAGGSQMRRSMLWTQSLCVNSSICPGKSKMRYGGGADASDGPVSTISHILSNTASKLMAGIEDGQRRTTKGNNTPWHCSCTPAFASFRCIPCSRAGLRWDQCPYSPSSRVRHLERHTRGEMRRSSIGITIHVGSGEGARMFVHRVQADDVHAATSLVPLIRAAAAPSAVAAERDVLPHSLAVRQFSGTGQADDGLSVPHPIGLSYSNTKKDLSNLWCCVPYHSSNCILKLFRNFMLLSSNGSFSLVTEFYFTQLFVEEVLFNNESFVFLTVNS